MVKVLIIIRYWKVYHFSRGR